MIKTTDGKRPSIETFPMSSSSNTSREFLSDINDVYPMAATAAGDDVVLAPKQALDILVDWHAQMGKGKFHTTGAHFCKYVDEMITLARTGHTLIITSDR
jgi:hypothetical protein